MHSNDWLPTLAGITKAVPNGKKLDGISQLKGLKTGSGIRTELFLGYENRWQKPPNGLNTALRWKEWKIVHLKKESTYKLFNIKKNPAETRDLSQIHTQTLKLMTSKLQKYVKDVGMRVQGTKCPDFNIRKCGKKCIQKWNNKSVKYVRPWC